MRIVMTMRTMRMMSPKTMRIVMTIQMMRMMGTIPITIPMTTVNMMRRLRKLTVNIMRRLRKLMDLNLMKKLNTLQALLVLAQNKANPERRAL